MREQILDRMAEGKSVVFLPGQVAKCRGTLADVPSPFLSAVGSLHISPIPVFLGYYTEGLDGLFRDDNSQPCREELCILPQLHPGPRTGERVLSAWMNKGADLFGSCPQLCGSVTSAVVRSLRANGKVKIIDGMTGSELPYFKALGVAMTVAPMLKKRGEARVGVILPPGAGGVIGTLSCMLAGVTPVLINYASSKAAFESTVRQAGLKTFITARKFRQKLEAFPWPPHEQCIYVEDLLGGLDKKKLIANVLMAKLAPASFLIRMPAATMTSV